ncbi:MAG: sulfurtransferase [Candidatus Krumholzibacteriia bacterium]
MTDYADPRVLVSTEWLAEHHSDPEVVVVEVDADTAAYDQGHVPGAVAWSWRKQMLDRRRRDILGLSDFENLLGRSGIGNHTTVVLYGDSNNWYATLAFWQLKVYGHREARVVDGGRKKWVAEERELARTPTQPNPTTYKSMALNQDVRAFLAQVKSAVKSRACALVDARSHDEYSGKLLGKPGPLGPFQRSGHIPGARCVPWALTCRDDGTFKGADELREIYLSKDITPDKEIITYSRVGERASHSWFILKYLLGYPKVRNYDGSYAEWGNAVGVAVETGDGKP